MIDLVFIGNTLGRLLGGAPQTLMLAGSSLALGAILALGLALLRTSGSRVADAFARQYIFFFRGTPLLVQIFLIYYGLGQFPAVRASFLWPFLRDAWWCALLALTLNTAAYGAEIIRGGLQAVPFGAVEAGRACGMSRLVLFRRIVLPLAVRQALPAYSNEIILMIKATSLASTITLMEITGIAQKINSETFRAVEVFCSAGLIYLAINLTIARLLGAVEWRLSPHRREAPHVMALEPEAVR